MAEQYSSEQQTGSEYGGVSPTVNTIQPKNAQALSNSEKLRLGYLTGVQNDPESIEDHRQFWGLRPADGRRPYWLDNTGIDSEADIQDVGERE